METCSSASPASRSSIVGRWRTRKLREPGGPSMPGTPSQRTGRLVFSWVAMTRANSWSSIRQWFGALTSEESEESTHTRWLSTLRTMPLMWQVGLTGADRFR
ncbi:MAG: hypothetical protein EHM61_09925 [Acidobacteria bacterium]|nr:MAG: hypothetical protein EHM61_09925 [Acidobacteriota bacterium]